MVVVRILVYQLYISGLLLFTCPLIGQVPSFITNEEGRTTGLQIKYQEEVIRSEITVKLAGSDHPVFGSVSVEENGLTFTPMVPFTPGLLYEVFHKDQHLITFQVPENAASTYLKGIYPSADTLPENLLKIYLEFSEPMGESYSENHVWVTSGDDTLHQVFLPLQPELWDSSHMRLTLWLDPGRIKRDLGPNTMWGTPLVNGKQYTIHVSDDWKDRRGRPLVTDFSKTFHAGEAVRVRPSITEWSIEVPPSDTHDPLIVDLGKPMDYSLLQESLRIFQGENQILVSTEISIHETSVYLHPREKWRSGIYHLKVASRLEDLAGNNLNRLFDRDVINDNETSDDQPNHMLTFYIQ